VTSCKRSQIAVRRQGWLVPVRCLLPMLLVIIIHDHSGITTNKLICSFTCLYGTMSMNKLAKYGLSDDFSDSSVTWPAVKIRAYHNSAEYTGPLRDTRCSFFEVNPKILNKRLGKSKKIMSYRTSFVKPQPDAVWEKVTAPFNYQREESLLSPSPSPETNRKVHILMEYNRQNGRKTHVELEYSTVLKALAVKGITHPSKKPSQRTPLQLVRGNSRVTKTKPVKQESSFDRPLFDSVVPYGVSLRVKSLSSSRLV